MTPMNYPLVKMRKALELTAAELIYSWGAQGQMYAPDFKQANNQGKRDAEDAAKTLIGKLDVSDIKKCFAAG